MVYGDARITLFSLPPTENSKILENSPTVFEWIYLISNIGFDVVSVRVLNRELSNFRD